MIPANRTGRAAALAAALLAVAGCAQKAEQAPAPRPVETVTVRLAEAANGAGYAGEVRARHENDLAFRVGGKVVERRVEVGAQVKKGALLARLDPQDAQLAAQAAASQVAAAQADLALARAELERFRSLHAQKFVSQALLDARQTAFDAAQARLAQARAQAEVSRNQSAYTSLHAERDGVITAVLAEPGQVVSAGQPVFRFARPEEKEVLINVPESRLAELRAAQELAVALWAQPQRRYLARVREIAPHADAATRTFAVRVAIPDADAEVRLGMTATVLLRGGSRGRAALLPLPAVFRQDGAAAVWVVDPGSQKVVLRKVEVAAYREEGAVVSAGLREGEVVVVRGVHKLLPGQQVRLAAAAAPGQGRAQASGAPADVAGVAATAPGAAGAAK